MPSSIGGLPTPNGATAPRIRLDIEDLAGALDLVTAPVFASTTTRDAAYASAIAAGKVGMRCYITNRAGYSTYVHRGSSTKAWVWEPQQNLIFTSARASAANATGTTRVDIILMPTVSLPPGNRLIQATIRTLMTNLTPAKAQYARAEIFTSYVANADSGVQEYLAAGSFQATGKGTWYFVANGSVDVDFVGLSTDPTTNVSFTNSAIQVFDLGPTDD